mgnify:CR=1 FL=1|jgi:hypothetical protein
MIVFDPSMIHSATNAEVTRYAYFATFFDAACDYILLPQRGATAPSFKYARNILTAAVCRCKRGSRHCVQTTLTATPWQQVPAADESRHCTGAPLDP